MGIFKHLHFCNRALFFTYFFLGSQVFGSSSDAGQDSGYDSLPSYQSVGLAYEDTPPSYDSQVRVVATIEERAPIPDGAHCSGALSLWQKITKCCFYVTGCFGDAALAALVQETDAVDKKLALYQRQQITAPLSLVNKRTTLYEELTQPHSMRNIITDYRKFRFLYAAYYVEQVTAEILSLYALSQLYVLPYNLRAGQEVIDRYYTAANLIYAIKLLVFVHIGGNSSAVVRSVQLFRKTDAAMSRSQLRDFKVKVSSQSTVKFLVELAVQGVMIALIYKADVMYAPTFTYAMCTLSFFMSNNIIGCLVVPIYMLCC